MERSINELVQTRAAMLEQVKALDVEIVERAESQRRELEQVLADIGASATKVVKTRRKRTPEQRADMSAAAKAMWAKRHAAMSASIEG